MNSKFVAAVLAFSSAFSSASVAIAGEVDSPMKVVTYTQWEETLEHYREQVLVVDVWASWCGPCIEKFPHMVEMSRQYEDLGVQFISLNMDDPDDDAGIEWSEDFLLDMEAGFPHFHMNENLVWSFEKLDLMALPVVLIYDESGAERFRLTHDDPNNQFDEQDVREAIESLIRDRS